MHYINRRIVYFTLHTPPDNVFDDSAHQRHRINSTVLLSAVSLDAVWLSERSTFDQC